MAGFVCKFDVGGLAEPTYSNITSKLLISLIPNLLNARWNGNIITFFTTIKVGIIVIFGKLSLSQVLSYNTLRKTF